MSGPKKEEQPKESASTASSPAAALDWDKAWQRAKQISSTAIAHSSSFIHNISEYAPGQIHALDFSFFLTPIKNLVDTVDAEVFKVSDKINTEYPQLSSMCRSHSSQLISTTSALAGLTVAYPVRRLFRGPFIKTFIYTGLLNAAAVATACQLVQYKWEYPRAGASKKKN